MSNILVIDDDREILENIQEILEFHNFRITTTTDSRTAIKLAREQEPDLILCDVVMPQLDGYDVLTQLRQDDTTATIPFIFLTALSDRSDLRLGMELGADDYLTKPFTDRELIKAITTCLEKQARLLQQYATELQQVEGLEKRLQEAQELAEIHSALLQKLSQNLRHPVANINIATHMLKRAASEADLDRYIAILEEECAREISLLNEVSSLQELIGTSRMSVLRRLKFLDQQ